MKNGDIVKISGADGIISHYGIVIEMLCKDAAFLKVPCKEDRDKAPAGIIVLGIDYLSPV
jgi:hypothetical protein